VEGEPVSPSIYELVEGRFGNWNQGRYEHLQMGAIVGCTCHQCPTSGKAMK
jgi:hypothetical protein